MANRIFTNFWLDVLSLIVMIGLAATGGLIHFALPAGTGHFYTLFGWNRHDIGQLHFYLAVAAMVLLALHVLLHWNWVCCVIAKRRGNETPSRKTQTMWGVSLLLGATLLLGGGLFWASTAVHGAVPEGRGRGRRAHLHATPSSREALASDRAVQAAVPTGSSVSTTVAPCETQPITRHGDTHDKHIEECPAARSIVGRTSLAQAATICGMSVAQLTAELRLPPHTAPREHLGRLKRHYGLDLHDVRRLACR